MSKNISRRKALKFFFGGFLSVFELIHGSSKQILIKKTMPGIINIIDLPKIGPWPTRDPFLFCVHHNDNYPRAKDDLSPNASLKGRDIGQDFSNLDGWSMYHGQKIPGFPRHPHRGFETLTVVNEGIIDHSDSLGASARYGDGDAQWLTAGDGINHSEMFPLFNRNGKNKIDFFQIWINLPSKSKRVLPYFSMFWNHLIPRVLEKDSNGIETSVEIIAGEYKTTKPIKPPPYSWASKKLNNVAVWIIKIEKNGKWKIPQTTQKTLRSLYIPKNNKISINGNNLVSSCRVDLITNTNIVVQNQGLKTNLLLLQGNPIMESVVQYGPFVMNSKDEIKEAFKDYDRTKFGGWKWESSAPVHGKKREKFARLIDGTLDKPL